MQKVTMLLLVSWPWTELARVTDGGLLFWYLREFEKYYSNQNSYGL